MFAVTALDVSMSHDDQKHLSEEDVKNLIAGYASNFSDFIVDVNVARMVSTSPAHVGVSNFPVSPIINTKALKESDAEVLDDSPAPEQQRDRGVKRPLEDDDDEDESAQKKHKSDAAQSSEKDESK
jgi:hypothetical protein